MKVDFHLFEVGQHYPAHLVTIEMDVLPLPGENVNLNGTQYAVQARAFELKDGVMACGVLVKGAESVIIPARPVENPGGPILFERPRQQ